MSWRGGRCCGMKREGTENRGGTAEWYSSTVSRRFLNKKQSECLETLDMRTRGSWLPDPHRLFRDICPCVPVSPTLPLSGGSRRWYGDQKGIMGPPLLLFSGSMPSSPRSGAFFSWSEETPRCLLEGASMWRITRSISNKKKRTRSVIRSLHKISDVRE